MPQRNLTPFLIFGAFVLLTTDPRLFVVVCLGYLAFRLLISKRQNSRFTWPAGLPTDLRRNIGRAFGVRPPVVTVRPKPSRMPLSFFQSPMSTSQTIRLLLGSLVTLLVVFVIIDGLVDVKPGYAAVKYDRGRGVLPEPLTEGLHLKIPFWQEVTKFQTRKLEFTMAGEYQEGKADEDAVRGRSKDGQDVVIDVTVTYQVAAADTPELRKQFRDEEGYQKTIMKPAARSVVYDSIGKFNALELIADKRSDFNGQIADNLRKIYAQNRIDLQEVFIRKITFSEGFASAIEEKQIAEQRIKTAQNRKLEAEQLKEKTIIEAEAEAEAIRLKGESLRENPEVIQLQFVEKMAPQINWGILPDGALPLIDLKSLQQSQQ